MSYTRNAYYLKIFTILCLLMTCFGSTSSYALEINSIRFGSNQAHKRIVLDLNTSSDFRAFSLDSPYRIVIDMPHFDWHAPDSKPPAHTMITDIRQGHLTQGISRIVFDLKTPISITAAYLIPKDGNLPNRLVIDYKSVNQEMFLRGKNKIHGSLNMDDYENAAKTPPASKNPFENVLNTYTTPAQNIASVNEYKEFKDDGIPRPPPNSMRPTARTLTSTAAVKRNKPLIIIDPGHGGVDPGAIGPNKIYEKNVVLALSKNLRDALLASGKYRVAMTREKDVFIRLKDRVKFARERGGDLFISIHADSIHKKHIRGTSIYTLSKKSSDAQTARLAERENQVDMLAGVDFSVEDKQVAFILGDFLMNDTMNQSKFFANTLVKKLKTNKMRTLKTPHRYAGFAVLKAPDIPSVLIETGFMSNAAEARLLNQPHYRKKLANAIKNGIHAYFDYVNKNEQN